MFAVNASRRAATGVNSLLTFRPARAGPERGTNPAPVFYVLTWDEKDQGRMAGRFRSLKRRIDV
jgi:hypothetical protein